MKAPKRHHIILPTLAVFLLCFALPSFAGNYLLIHKTATTLNVRLEQNTELGPGHFKVYENNVLQPGDWTYIGPVIVDNNAGTVNIEFNTTEPVPLYNVSATTYDGYSMHGYQFWVVKGTLNLSLGSGYNSATTLRRDTYQSDTNPLMHVFRVSSKDAGGANCRLTISGNANHHFVVDGGAKLAISGTNATGYTAKNETGGLTSRGALLAVYGSSSYHGGTVELDYVDLVNNWNKYYDGTSPLTSGLGGAVHLNTNNSSVVNLTMRNCRIENCYAENSGAAMMIQGTNYATASSLTMVDCETLNCFTDCTGGAGYGGTYRTSSGPNFNITMKRCSIHDNVSDNWAGAICYNLTNELKLDTCRISGNYGAAGGLYCQGPTKLDSCTIKNNYATSEGGGLYCNAASTEVKNCLIKNNTATTKGGGLYCNAATELNDCTITGNSATTDGGGLYCNASTGVNDCTITGNSATSSASGGGVYCGATTLAVNECIITGNSATSNGGGIYIGGTGEGGNGVVTLSGTVIVDNNQKIGSVIENNVFVDQTEWRVVYIGEAGLECGSSIGISNRLSDRMFAQGEGSASVAALNCNNAYRNHYFFDDNGAYTAVNSDAVYPTRPSEPYYDGYGSNLWFYDKAFIAGYLDSWHDQTATAGTDYVLTGGYVSEVKTAAGLAYFSKHVLTNDYTGKTVTLSNSISLDGHNWEPIGYNAGCALDAHPFTGTFDGQGHAITDMNCPFQYADVGLFGYVQGGTLKNIIVGGSINAIGATNAGGVVGQLDGGTVYNCYSYVELTGSENATLAGVVGNLVNGGSLENSFANPKFTVSSGSGLVGGLVGENAGTVENCYVRLSRTQSLGSAHFGMLAGSNTGTDNIVQCYAPDGASSQFNHSYTYLYNNVSTGLQNCDLYKKVDAPYLYNRPYDNLVGSTGKTLTEKLNEWVSSEISSNSNLAYWKRTTAGGYSYDFGSPSVTYTGGNINDDYPIHMMNGLSNAASPDGLCIEYSRDLGTMLTKYNGLTGGGTVWLYASPKNAGGTYEEVNVNNDSDVLLYIDEGVSLLQNASNSLTAYTSQTIPGNPRSWHFLSSSLQQSYIGFTYGQNATFNWEANPCHVTISTDDDHSLFPSDLPKVGGYSDVYKIDLYCFYEPEYHWLNLKRSTNSHYHMNAQAVQIEYNGNGLPTGNQDGNETILVPGKGYLVSIDKDQLLQNKGTLNNGDVTLYNVTRSGYNAWAERLGYNLLGNPYQSYLDFTKFINYAGNSGLYLEDQSKGISQATYAIYDSKLGGYVQYKAGSSKGSIAAGDLIPPHQGFLVRRTGGDQSATATYTNAMRSNDGSATFRGEQPTFPVINLMVTDGEGDNDMAVLELSREGNEGAEKLRANTCKGWLYLHHEGGDYAILFRDTVTDYQPLWFDADEAGTYTLSWNTANVAFDELTLVDNVTGTQTDMLQRDSYSFEADPEQYSSRFKLIIGTFKPIHGVEESAEEETDTFAYVSNGMLVVSGEGQLEIIDMMGRTVRSEAVHGTRNTVSMPQVTAGVYVLRLTSKGETRVQKIVVE